MILLLVKLLTPYWIALGVQAAIGSATAAPEQPATPKTEETVPDEL